MSNYIYTNDGLVNTDELMHYGVPGMRWGHRKGAYSKVSRADRNIGRYKTYKKNNANTYKQMNAEAKSKYYTSSNKYKNTVAKNKALYDRTEVVNDYNIAKQKAKKDKTYKKSKEYVAAKQKYGKQFTQDYVYGPAGSVRIDTLKNRGYSERKAKGRVIAEQVLVGVGSLAVMGAIIKSQG